MSDDDLSLREYVDAMLTEREKAINAALAASEKAIAKAEMNAEKWRESANEWRGAMSDRDRELPSRKEVEVTTGALDARLSMIETWQSKVTGGLVIVAFIGVANFIRLWTT